LEVIKGCGPRVFGKIVASTFASTLPQNPFNLLIYIGYFLLKLLIILWSQVQVLVGPPFKKLLTSKISGFFYLYFGRAGMELVSANSSEIKVQAQAVIQS